MPSRPQLTLEGILTFISHLVRRPARVDHRLPLIWLSGRERGTRVLDALAARLRASRRFLVPHVRVEAIAGRSVRDIRSLLHILSAELGAPRFGGERLRFRHYELAEWLMDLNLSQLSSEDRAREIVALLRGHHRRRSQDNDLNVNEIDFGPQYRLPIWLIRRVVPEVLFRAAVSGKVPGLGSRYRWFMRQQYLAPSQSVSFLGFAERLTEGVREREDADQVDKLLAHAFLQDLRRAYRRRLWRIEGWRRTAYPVVLIDNATAGSVAYRLLQLINEVRNETGRSDPLVVVCSSDEVPQAPAPATRRGVVEPDSGTGRNGDPLHHESVYREWAEALPGSRRARMETAWDLPISVADSDGAEPAFGAIVPRRPPRLARRSVVIVAVVTLITAGIAGVYWQYGDWPACTHTPFYGQVNVRDIGGECIGYSDRDFRFNDVPGQGGGPGQEALLRIQDKIFEQNQNVKNLWERGNRIRPYVTLVYLGIFTGRPVNPTEESYSGEREELEGLAIAQRDSINQPATAASPLLHIVIANGGHDMEYAREAVDVIGGLAAQDPTVVGVIGMDESRDTTAQALARLNRIGLPVIATTLSADRMDRNSRLYLQIGAGNQEQARLIADYSKRVLKLDTAQVYWTTGGVSSIDKDLYVKTLVDDLNVTLPQFGIKVDNIQNEKLPIELPVDVCNYRGAIIFAGRWGDFSNFLVQLRERCPNGQLLNVIADDSVSRYMVNPTLRMNAPATLSVTYVSKTSSLITCNSLRDSDDNSQRHFYGLIQAKEAKEIFESPPCSQGNREIPERLPLAYDGATLVLEAVEGLDQDLRGGSRQEWDPRSIVPISVYLKIRQRVRQAPFDGITGTLSFLDNGSDPGEPVERRISLLKVRSVPDFNALPVEVFHCGQVQTSDSPLTNQGQVSNDPVCGQS